MARKSRCVPAAATTAAAAVAAAAARGEPAAPGLPPPLRPPIPLLPPPLPPPPAQPADPRGLETASPSGSTGPPNAQAAPSASSSRILPSPAPLPSASASASASAAAAAASASASAVAAALPSSLQHASLAAWFVHFDEDASGDVDREEFRRNLWMLTRATEEERMAYAFQRLDANGSGELERADLEQSMRRQLVSDRAIEHPHNPSTLRATTLTQRPRPHTPHALAPDRCP